jgi:endonuclease III
MLSPKKTYAIFVKHYPDVKCALHHKTPLQLLVATILSAQSTDKQINKLTPALFRKYKNAKDFAGANIKELEHYVHSSGFFRNKAKNIIAASKMLLNDFQGVVPDSMDDLIKLPGVARKTANVVLFNAFGKNEGIAVDTHVERLSQRLGFTEQKDPKKIEAELMELFPRNIWGMLTHYLIEHGRNVCTARKPKCGQCFLAKDCPSSGLFD